MSTIQLTLFNQILTYKKHFSRNNMHTMFTTSNSKFLRNNQFFFFIRFDQEISTSPLIQNDYFFNSWRKSNGRIMGTLTWCGQTHKMLLSVSMFICMQKINFINIFFLSYWKNITIFLFWVLWLCLAKTIMTTCRNFDVYLHAKN